MKVGGDDWELRPWHYIHVYSIERSLIFRTQVGAAVQGGRSLGLAGVTTFLLHKFDLLWIVRES